MGSICIEWTFAKVDAKNMAHTWPTFDERRRGGAVGLRPNNPRGILPSGVIFFLLNPVDIEIPLYYNLIYFERGGGAVQKCVYIPETPVNRKVIDRVKKMEQEYGVSFSEVVVQALKELVAVTRPKVKKGDFRSAKLGLLR